MATALGTMTTDEEVEAKKGTGVNSAYTDAMQDLAVLQIEGLICTIAQYDFVTNWASINSIFQAFFSDICSSYIAVQAIKYDMSLYTDLREAENMINVETTNYNRGLSLLRNQIFVDYIKSVAA